jgi:hypothetical protein
MIPDEFSLVVNPPERCEPGSVMFEVPSSTRVTIRIYDGLGKTIRTLVDDHIEAGRHELPMAHELLPSGVYYYRMEAGTFIETRKVLLVKSALREASGNSVVV